MKPKLSADHWLALFFLVSAILLIFIWIPLDTDTGLVKQVRRKYVIGDALAPTLAGIVIILGVALILLRPAHNKALKWQNLSWVATLLGLFTLSLIVMRYAGPLIASWTELGYRPLRATPPWHYIGFLLGGTVMVGGITSLVTRRFAVKDFVIGFVTSLTLALLYDVPFNDLIIPPNGDI